MEYGIDLTGANLNEPQPQTLLVKSDEAVFFSKAPSTHSSFSSSFGFPGWRCGRPVGPLRHTHPHHPASLLQQCSHRSSSTAATNARIKQTPRRQNSSQPSVPNRNTGDQRGPKGTYHHPFITIEVALHDLFWWISWFGAHWLRSAGLCMSRHTKSHLIIMVGIREFAAHLDYSVYSSYISVLFIVLLHWFE